MQTCMAYQQTQRANLDLQNAEDGRGSPPFYIRHVYSRSDADYLPEGQVFRGLKTPLPTGFENNFCIRDPPSR